VGGADGGDFFVGEFFFGGLLFYLINNYNLFRLLRGKTLSDSFINCFKPVSLLLPINFEDILDSMNMFHFCGNVEDNPQCNHIFLENYNR